MKPTGKKVLLHVAVLVLLCSCVEEDGLHMSEGEGRVFRAELTQDTKVGVDEGFTTFWHESDKISVFQGPANERYTFNGRTGDVSGTFTRDDSQPEPDEYADGIVIYPYDGQATLREDGKVETVLPAIQDYAPSGFDPQSNLMVSSCRTDDDNLRFRNACGYLMIRLYGEDMVSRLTLKSNSGLPISGKAVISCSGKDMPVLDMNQDGEDSITIDCGSGVRLGKTPASATQFWFVLPPLCLTGGMTVDVINSEGEKYSITTKKDILIERSVVRPMTPVEITVSGGCDFLSFGIETGGMLYKAHKVSGPDISVCIPKGTDKTALKAHFTDNCSKVVVNGSEQSSGTSVNDFSQPVQYTCISSSGKEKTYTIYLQEEVTSIACWGDSYTELGGGWPNHLRDRLPDHFTVYAGGKSSDRTQEIAARQGGLRTFTAGDFTFAEGTSRIPFPGVVIEEGEITTGGERPFRGERFTTSSPYVNNCIIAGIECSLYYNTSTGHHISRIAGGEELFVPAGTEIFTSGSRLSKEVDLTVVYMGQNGGYDNDYERLVRQHWRMINHTGSKEYIVFTYHHKVVDGYLPLFYDAFGAGASRYTTTQDRRSHIVNLREEINARAVELLLSTGAFTDESQIPDKDWKAISLGNLPKTFFMSDTDSHPCEYGSKAFATVLEDKLKEMGYIYGEPPVSLSEQTPSIEDGGEIDPDWK
jgi:hypothetical protein